MAVGRDNVLASGDELGVEPEHVLPDAGVGSAPLKLSRRRPVSFFLSPLLARSFARAIETVVFTVNKK